ncbi:Exocyst complex component 6 [Armadillidium nasatum]|uniref:Exocyst complex component n=1 Tax=Armadillidium nasatum TaxID=96803 RepID=A0A5N5SWB8_9CRUS|nr:Exocyst complex component 6 [Armadillidium nasatum]
MTDISNDRRGTIDINIKTTELTEEDSVDQKHELFLHEIEAIEEYWGPTFRTIYDGDEHGKFMDKLDARIKNHDKDIERMCNHHYQGFIDSIRELLQVRSQANKLRAEVVRIDKDIQSSAGKLLAKSEDLVKARKVQVNIASAIDSLSLCLPVLTTYSKLQTQMQQKRYYPALKTLEQLEHAYLPRVACYRFAQQMRDNIPRVREDIKMASMSDIKDFLEAIRRDHFESYYRQQRKEQARLALQSPTNMHESLEGYRDYLHGVVGFFVIEDHILNTGNGLVNRAYLDEVWDMACGKNYGYTVSALHDLLLEIKDHYNEVLMQKWVQVFRETFDEDTYHPIRADTLEDYQRIIEVFPYEDAQLEQSPFPKYFPFSLMVPKVYRQVKDYIAACLDFSEDLNLSQTEKEDMVRKSTNLLLTRTLSGCLASHIKKPGLGLLQLIQITNNTFHLEHANVLLENYVARLTGSEDSRTLGSKGGMGQLQGKVIFKDIRGEAEEQIYTALRLKLDEILDLAAYDWMMAEPCGQSSSYITDLISFLKTTFDAFTNLQLRVAQTACMSACQHIARSLLDMLLNENVKQMSLAALEQLNLDVIQCEQFAASEPVEGFEEGALLMYFSDLRQLLDLFMSEDWSTYFHDYGKEKSKYLRVHPHQAIIIVEKLREGEKKGMFSILKRNDKKKLLETVLKQLKQLSQQQQNVS